MQKVLILLGAADDLSLTEQGQHILRDFRVSYQIRVASAQVAPDYVKDIVTSFQSEGGQVIVCLASPQDRLASLVSSLCQRPVLHVAASESPVSLEQLPGPLPIATLGIGSSGFAQASLFILQILALQDSELYQNGLRHRHSLAARMIAADQKHRVTFDV
ncbi:MAG TPA: AIR carboxylase family protein [Oligoflexus sp.]|uniref:AIR carboxylase family protein n=1 Tax=Oligoflexus sp. TaxID=1971216 RepID=UPI002D5FD29E|nr:AIR carboxylase family protein [Oligoflexus sp.]HYX39398.1 AIR carboxylase family protein [Oligoflexus sp.]